METKKANQSRPILVVDDDPRSCELITAILAEADFEVLSASDGPSGIELARTAQPAVIVLDMLMPGMDGISTLQGLKRDPLLKDIPVVGITAASDLTYAKQAFRAGALSFLPKPFSAASLRRMVELASDSIQHETPVRRRRHPRLPAEIAVRCSIQGEAGTTWEAMGHTGNVSLGGLLLWLPEPVAPKTAVRLKLELPECPITAKGMVRWRGPQPAGDERFGHGRRYPEPAIWSILK